MFDETAVFRIKFALEMVLHVLYFFNVVSFLITVARYFKINLKSI